jgi:hypothetical protein
MAISACAGALNFSAKYQTADILTDLFEEGDGHLCAVVSGVLQQQSEDFQGEHLMGHLWSKKVLKLANFLAPIIETFCN